MTEGNLCANRLVVTHLTRTLPVELFYNKPEPRLGKHSKNDSLAKGQCFMNTHPQVPFLDSLYFSFCFYTGSSPGQKRHSSSVPNLRRTSFSILPSSAYDLHDVSSRFSHLLGPCCVRLGDMYKVVHCAVRRLMRRHRCGERGVQLPSKFVPFISSLCY